MPFFFLVLAAITIDTDYNAMGGPLCDGFCQISVGPYVDNLVGCQICGNLHFYKELSEADRKP